MLAVRIIPCLDVDDGRVVKGVKFKEIRDAGDPVALAREYNAQGADELVFLDIGASYKSRETLIEVVEAVSRQVFIPLSVGGGIRSVEDMRLCLTHGADKVANSIDMDGTKRGYELELTRRVAEAVHIPVIASGGAGTMDQIADAFVEGRADAALLASLLHFGECTIQQIKDHLKNKGVVIRW